MSYCYKLDCSKSALDRAVQFVEKNEFETGLKYNFFVFEKNGDHFIVGLEKEDVNEFVESIFEDDDTRDTPEKLEEKELIEVMKPYPIAFPCVYVCGDWRLYRQFMKQARRSLSE